MTQKDQERLGKTPVDRNKKLCTIIQKISINHIKNPTLRIADSDLVTGFGQWTWSLKSMIGYENVSTAAQRGDLDLRVRLPRKDEMPHIGMA